MNYNLVNFCEFDKYATKSYCAIHGVDERLNLGDITQVDIENLPSEGVDLITHGSPCQSFSIAGKQHGGVKGSNTRSSLLWNSVGIICHCKPKFVIWENVKNVLSAKHKPVFDNYVDEMKNIGYNTYYRVLNAKNYGIPQNRERIYAISVREDIDNNQDYTGNITHNKYYDRNDKSLFPEPFDNGLRLKDFLEAEVDERYYLKDEQVNRLTILQKECKEPATENKIEPNEISMLGMLNIKGNEQVRRVYGTNGLSPTLNTMQGGNREPKVLVKEATKTGYKEAQNGDYVNIGMPNSNTRRGRVGNQIANTLTTQQDVGVVVKEHRDSLKTMCLNSKEGRNGVKGLQPSLQNRIYSCDGVSTAATTSQFFMPKYLDNATIDDLCIRKLTPRECYRLMGFGDEDFDRAVSTGNSSTQLYKQAGNSIVVNVLVEIYKCLQVAYPNDFTTGMNVISLFSGIGAFEKALERL